MVTTVKSREELEKLVGEEGDVVVVEEGPGVYTRSYVWHLDHWAHNEGYECPLRSHDPEPNA